MVYLVIIIKQPLKKISILEDNIKHYQSSLNKLNKIESLLVQITNMNIYKQTKFI